MRYILSVIFCLVPLLTHATQFGFQYGGSANDQINFLSLTNDGGTILAGTTRSFGSPNEDAWLILLDAEGNIANQNRYGSGLAESIEEIQQTNDGGWIAAGSIGGTNRDGWLMRLNSTGEILWQRTYRSTASESFYSVQETADGFVAAGKVGSDAWILSVDRNGMIRWQKGYGSGDKEEFRSIRKISDGNLIAVGNTDSFGAEEGDAWVVKLDVGGNILWQKRYGGPFRDEALSVEETGDRGIVFAGRTGVSTSDTDGWVVRLNSIGKIVWQRRVGKVEADALTDVDIARNGDVLLSGSIQADGSARAWILRLRPNGSSVWQNTYGTIGATSAPQLKEALDGGILLSAERINGSSLDGIALKLTNSGSPGSSCSNISASYPAKIAQTSNSSSNTSGIPVNTRARSLISAVNRSNTDAEISNLCTQEVSSRTGVFSSNPKSDYQVNGTATLQLTGGSLQLILGSDFQSSSGPRLEVYLSNSNSINTGSITLGRLQRTTGSQTYNVPSDVTLTTYDWVIIHCVSFNVSFGYARLN
ncbi:DM13 domain-containing protein [bacterium]|nr:DM13 domain-containing protein [bacterium]MCI0615824.1 DM13 domain-containing protein [bacterium]